MADYSDAYEDTKDAVRRKMMTRMRGEGFIPKFKTPRGWAADHIEYLECLWCGVLVCNDRLHRNFCTGPLVADPDIEPPPPPPLDLTPGV